MASDKMQLCPVPPAKPVRGDASAEASQTYFGRESGNELLADLSESCDGVAWAADHNRASDKTKLSRVLKWLGVSNHPRIVDEEPHEGYIPIRELPESCDAWKDYLETARDNCDRRIESIATLSRIDHLSVDNLDAGHGALLIRLIARQWETYYPHRAHVAARGRLSREQYYRSWPVMAKWP